MPPWHHQRWLLRNWGVYIGELPVEPAWIQWRIGDNMNICRIGKVQMENIATTAQRRMMRHVAENTRSFTCIGSLPMERAVFATLLRTVGRGACKMSRLCSEIPCLRRRLKRNCRPTRRLEIRRERRMSVRSDGVFPTPPRCPPDSVWEFCASRCARICFLSHP